MKTVVAAALGECVHVAGVLGFLRLAEEAGWRTVFLGPATPIEEVVAAAERENADLVAVSYRLTPETGATLLGSFAESADDLRERGVRFVFGGTPPVAEKARSLGFFERVFDGSDSNADVLAYLHGSGVAEGQQTVPPQSTVERIRWKAPYPILRHHFGQPLLQDTIAGVAEIAKAGVLDVVSLGTDQDAQANFFHPERRDPARTGAGGVPVRRADDYRRLYEATRQGNYPLMRTYTGTDDFVQLAQVYMDTIHIAWPAIPIFWFNRMDGRGPWELEDSIQAHMELMGWYAKRGVPVEVNEPHHWGLRDAPDVIFVATAYLSAHVAKACGVKDYIAQMMFNSPSQLSDSMDLAKMLACLDLVQRLEGSEFRVWRQTRTGLLSYPQNPDAARAHLAASIYLQMAIKPHIVHVVAHTEAHHAASADEVIEACTMAQRVIENAVAGQPDMTHDPLIQRRREELVAEAIVLLDAIRALGASADKDPLTDPATLALAIEKGLLDAPHLTNNAYACGAIRMSRDKRGACVAVDATTGEPLTERQRLATISS